MTIDHNLQALGRLIEIMDRLRSPGGCPWDAEQTPESLIPYLLEETHETIEALERGDPHEICDELGDLLLQIVFHARIFSERGAFDVGDIATAIADKLVRRHPHVFAREAQESGVDLTRQWDAIKAGEQAARGVQKKALDQSIPATLPALHRTQKLIDKSERHGRQWPEAAQSLTSAQAQLHDFGAAPTDENFGELLLTLVLLARQQGLDAEGSLRRAATRTFALPQEQP